MCVRFPWNVASAQATGTIASAARAGIAHVLAPAGVGYPALKRAVGGGEPAAQTALVLPPRGRACVGRDHDRRDDVLAIAEPAARVRPRRSRDRRGRDRVRVLSDGRTPVRDPAGHRTRSCCLVAKVSHSQSVPHPGSGPYCVGPYRGPTFSRCGRSDRDQPHQRHRRLAHLLQRHAAAAVQVWMIASIQRCATNASMITSVASLSKCVACSNRAASTSCWKHRAKSSAYRTTLTSPRACRPARGRR
jgi:hypothetical protein